MTDTQENRPNKVGPAPKHLVTGTSSILDPRDFTPCQTRALDTFAAWWRTGEGPEFRLGGHAGTGKTTFVRSALAALGISAIYAAPTNRAARVLSERTHLPATTLHALLTRVAGELVRPDGTTEPLFEDNLWPAAAPLLVVDEASMVGKDMVRRLRENFPGRVLAMGDPLQLPPVGEVASALVRDPHVTLTTITRQEAGSPILLLAGYLRDGATARAAWESAEKSGHFALRDGERPDQIITWRNAERLAVTERLRKERGLTMAPTAGDRVVALNTCHSVGVFNGDQTYIHSVTSGPFGGLHLHGGDLSDRLVTVGEVTRSFTAEKPDPADRRLQLAHADAITCHKAQGGQWSHVHVAERPSGKELFTRQWLYTAVTRAQSRLTIGGVA